MLISLSDIDIAVQFKLTFYISNYIPVVFKMFEIVNFELNFGIDIFIPNLNVAMPVLETEVNIMGL